MPRREKRESERLSGTVISYPPWQPYFPRLYLSLSDPLDLRYGRISIALNPDIGDFLATGRIVCVLIGRIK